jgi:hypothetical protein
MKSARFFVWFLSVLDLLDKFSYKFSIKKNCTEIRPMWTSLYLRMDDMTIVRGIFRDYASEPTKYKHEDYCSADWLN